MLPRTPVTFQKKNCGICDSVSSALTWRSLPNHCLHPPLWRPHLCSNEIIAPRYRTDDTAYSPVHKRKQKEEKRRSYSLKGPTKWTLLRWSRVFSRLLLEPETLQTNAFNPPMGFPLPRVTLPRGLHGQDSVELIAHYTFSVPDQAIKSQHARRAMTFR